MNRRDYRAAFDAVDFSADFEERTLQKLAAVRQASEKEQIIMPMNRVKKTALLVAAAVALLAVSVSAAVVWLTPAQVADRVEEPLLAEAFQSEDAIVLDESVTAGDYQITLAGMVSGEDLSVPTDYNGEIINDRTYAVFRVARADGEPLTDYPNLSYSPLVDGYHVRCVNAWTLGTTTQQFIEDGVIYCLFDCRNLEMFADHPVRFAIYEGGIPNTDLFSMAEDGTISLRESVVGALFTLRASDIFCLYGRHPGLGPHPAQIPVVVNAGLIVSSILAGSTRRSLWSRFTLRPRVALRPCRARLPRRPRVSLRPLGTGLSRGARVALRSLGACRPRLSGVALRPLGACRPCRSLQLSDWCVILLRLRP